MSVLSQISNCQSLGRKNKHEILKTDRIPPPRCATRPCRRTAVIVIMIIVIIIIIIIKIRIVIIIIIIAIVLSLLLCLSLLFVVVVVVVVGVGVGVVVIVPDEMLRHAMPRHTRM